VFHAESAEGCTKACLSPPRPAEDAERGGEIYPP